MRISALFLLAMLFCSGCAFNSYNGDTGAYDGVAEVSPQASACIAKYAASHLSAIYPPGRTSLSFDNQTHFGEALEAATRKRGFSIASGGLPVGYTLDMLSPATCYLSLSVPDGVITQSFTLNGYSESNAAIPDYTCTKTGLLAFSELSCQPLADYQLDYATALPEPLPARTSLAAASSSLPTSSYEPIQAESVPVQPEQPAQLAQKEEAKPESLAAGPAVATPDKSDEVKPVAADIPAAPATETAIYEPEPVLEEVQQLPPSWRMYPGLLRPQLEAWASEAGYSVVWKAKRDFEMETEVNFEADFIGMLHNLFLQMHEQGTPLKVTVYQGNNVVEITEE
ncbi:MAG: TcpQ domain-containing protein [Deltaproteobacteria bacterium]|jgi:hypothetical protein|nr:TcpQ domain-containing protein [Deltaproteobacteria bacterium]